jgi:hypothetical protein
MDELEALAERQLVKQLKKNGRLTPIKASTRGGRRGVVVAAAAGPPSRRPPPAGRCSRDAPAPPGLPCTQGRHKVLEKLEKLGRRPEEANDGAVDAAIDALLRRGDG